MIYEGWKILGPYYRRDGRGFVVVTKPNGKKSTISYPKYLMEIKLDRYLEKNETVDHDDKDITNDK